MTTEGVVVATKFVYGPTEPITFVPFEYVKVQPYRSSYTCKANYTSYSMTATASRISTF